MKKNNKSIDYDKLMKIRGNLNNLVPGESVNEHRAFETGNLIQAKDEIQQQNENS